MAKKDIDSDIVYRGASSGERGNPGLGFIVGIFALCWLVHRSGYSTGVSVSSKVLRRHDKDVRRMKKEAAKREKQLKKELQPKEEQTKWRPW